MHVATLTPQFSDSDALGHINYQATVRWFETGRLPIYKLVAPDMRRATRFLAMVHMEVDYAREMLLGDEVTIHTRITRIGNCSFDVSQEAFQEGIQCSTGRVVLVYYNLATRHAEPLPVELREQLERFA